MTRVKPRTFIFHVLGYYVRHFGAEIRLKDLVVLGEECGVPGPTTRVLASRMQRDGWLTSRRQGRESIYGLTAQCLRRLDEGHRRVFRSEPGPWSRTWSMVIYTVPENDRPTREQLRRELSWLGFGALAPATWVSPHPRLDDVANVGASLPNARIGRANMTAHDLAADRSIASRCWDLDSLNREYRAFIRDLRQQLPSYRRGHIDSAAAMMTRSILMGSYRNLLFNDPGLPVELQPPGWVGNHARALFLEANELLETPAIEHYRSVVGSTSGVDVSARDLSKDRWPRLDTPLVAHPLG